MTSITAIVDAQASAGDALAHFASAPVANLPDLTGGKPFMVIAPHPDDETLGCGGLMALAARQGTHCTIAVMTDGVRAHLNSKKFDAAARREMRESESRAAAEMLGLSAVNVVFLRQPDGFLPHEGPEGARLVGELDDIVSANGIATIFVTWAADPHPDHSAAANLVMQLAAQRKDLAVFAYPIWGLTLDSQTSITAPFAPALRLEVRPVRGLKRKAVACFASQIAGVIDDDPDGFQLSVDDLDRFCSDFETFIGLTPQGQKSVQKLSSVPTEHFEALYEKSLDPWQYVANSYEQGRFHATLAALPAETYHNACEIGCSIGVLTQLLAQRCDTILGIDCSAKAINEAHRRLADMPNATARLMRVPGELPEGTFDLIVLSEVLYFFSQFDLASMAQFVTLQLQDGGTCILVNFLGDTESPMAGKEAAERFIALLPPALRPVTHQEFEGFRIDVLVRETVLETV